MIWVIIIPLVLVFLSLKFNRFADHAMSEHLTRQAEFKAKYKGK